MTALMPNFGVPGVVYTPHLRRWRAYVIAILGMKLCRPPLGSWSGQLQQGMDPYVGLYTVDDLSPLLDWLEDPTDLSAVSKEANNTGTSLSPSTDTAALWPGLPAAAAAWEAAEEAHEQWQLNSNSGNSLSPAWTLPECVPGHWLSSPGAPVVHASCALDANLVTKDANDFFAGSGVHAAHTSSPAAGQLCHWDPPKLTEMPQATGVALPAAAAPPGLPDSPATAREPPAAVPAAAAAPGVGGLPLGMDWTMALPVSTADFGIAGAAAAVAGWPCSSLDQGLQVLGAVAADTSCQGAPWSTHDPPAAGTFSFVSTSILQAADMLWWQQSLLSSFSSFSAGSLAAPVTGVCCGGALNAGASGAMGSAGPAAAAAAAAATVSCKVAAETDRVVSKPSARRPNKPAARRPPPIGRPAFKAAGHRRAAALGDAGSSSEKHLLMLAAAKANDQAKLSRKAALQSTLQALVSSRAQLVSRLGALQSDLAAMTAANQELHTANGAMQAQLEAEQMRLWGACT